MEDTLNERVGVLDRREIEARIVAPLFEAMCLEVGEARAREILEGVVRRAARDTGRALRERAPDGDLEAFAALWEPWFRGGALTIEEGERSADRWRFDVTRCRYAELYRSLGMEALGATLSCDRDAALIEGFDPSVRLDRTGTLMQGAPCCDFLYRRRTVDTAAGGEGRSVGAPERGASGAPAPDGAPDGSGAPEPGRATDDAPDGR